MAIKTNWMDQYFVAVRQNVLLYQGTSGSAGDNQSASHTNAGALTTGNGSSAGGGDKLFTTDTEAYGFGDNTDTKRFQVALNNHPDLEPNQDIANQSKAIGTPVRTGGQGYEMTRGGISPRATLDFDVDTRTIVPFLWALFQEGASETTVDQSDGSDILTNGDFESGFSGGLATGWTEAGSPTTTEETSQTQTPGSSQQVDVTAAGEGIYQTVTVDPTRSYTITGYVYSDGTNQVDFQVLDGGLTGSVLHTDNFTAASWTSVTANTVVYPTETTMTILIDSNAAGSFTFYVDTCGVTDAKLYSHLQFEPKKVVSGADPASAEAYISVLRRMSNTDADSICLSDGVVSNMTLSAAEGEALRCSAEIVGRFLDTDLDVSDLSPSLLEGFAEQPPLMWHDAVITMEDVDDANGDHYVIPASAFSLTITPTVSIRRYDSRWPVRYVYGRWSISGSITFPWTMIGTADGAIGENYALRRLVRDDSATQNNITPMELYVTWFGDPNVSLKLGDNLDGTSGSTVDDIRDFASADSIGGGNHHHGDFGLYMGITPTNVETSGEEDGETMVTLSFECVDIRSANSVTQQALEIFILDKRNYGIDDLVTTPAPTLITNHA